LKEKIFQAVLVLVLLVTTGFTSCIKAQEEASPPKSSLPPEFFLDSDGDGFNDWFETNIAGYNPSVPNDRYIILFSRFDEDPGTYEYSIDKPYQFFTERGKILPENIIRLYSEEATGPNLKNAIGQVAKKSDQDDIVFLKIDTHGYTIASFSSGDKNISSWDYMDKSYTMIDEWLDKIKAKAVIVTIMACGCERALPLLKDGSCPRIVFAHSGGEFIGGLGEDPEYAITADTKYGNGDGYVSVGEISNWIDNDPKWGPDGGIYETMEERYEKGRSHLEANGYSKMSDTSNIAYQIYLTDYTPTLDKAP